MGSGFRTFATSEVLTASNVQNFLMEQSVMSFASTGARDVSITAPEDGMVAYIGSNDVNEGLYTYNGTSWRKGPGWNAPWGVVTTTAGGTSSRGYAVTTTSTSTTTGTTDWSGLTVTFTGIANRIYQTIVHGMLTSDNAGGSDYAELVLRDSSNNVLTRSRAIVQLNVYEGRSLQYVEANSTGSLTRKVSVTRSSGSGNVSGYAAAGFQASITVVDIGPSGAPA